MTDIESCKDGVQEGRASPSERGEPRGGPEGAAPPELDYIPLFTDFYDRYSELSYEERGRLVWAMLAYTKGKDPGPHLTGELRRFCFPNEREVIDRTAKVHQERKERRRAASQIANAVKYNRSESDRSPPIRSDSEHNNNYNNNNNHNDNGRGGTKIVHGANRRSAVGKPDPVGRGKIL